MFYNKNNDYIEGGSRMLRNRISIFIIAFLVLGFFFVTMPENGISGMAFDLGCCRTESAPPLEPGGECIACEGFNCYTSESFCASEGGFYTDGFICSEQDDSRCLATVVQDGCCVTEQGICVDDQTALECSNNIAGGEIWVSAQSCSSVPQCGGSTANVPTLSEWGLIAMAGILGLVGFFLLVRRKVAA